MNVASIIRFSVVDYPDKLSCVIFTQGCNLRCPYCYNPELLEFCEGKVRKEYLFNFLSSRIGKMDAVVITGGEPTLQEGLYDFLSTLKNMGFLIKLDTNGTNPKLLKKIIKEKVVDYVAMDVKLPLEKYNIVGFSNKELILCSIDIILNSDISYEFRTTYVRRYLKIEDFEEIGKIIKGAKKFALQSFLKPKNKKILDMEIKREEISEDEIKKISEIMKNFVKEMELRI